MVTAHKIFFRPARYVAVEWGKKRASIDLTNFPKPIVEILVDYQYGCLELETRRLLDLVQLATLAIYLGHDQLLTVCREKLKEAEKIKANGLNLELELIFGAVRIPPYGSIHPIDRMLIRKLGWKKLAELAFLLPDREIERTNLVSLLVSGRPFVWEEHPLIELAGLLKATNLPPGTVEELVSQVVDALPEEQLGFALQVVNWSGELSFFSLVGKAVVARLWKAKKEEHHSPCSRITWWEPLLLEFHLKDLDAHPMEKIEIKLRAKSSLSAEEQALLVKGVEEGDPRALTAQCYQPGRDVTEISEGLLQGAEAGDAYCMALLGRRLNDEAEGDDDAPLPGNVWLQRASEAGVFLDPAETARNLAEEAQSEGKEDEAVAVLKRFAGRGHRSCIYQLGLIMESDKSSPVEAKEYFQTAALLGSRDATNKLIESNEKANLYGGKHKWMNWMKKLQQRAE